MKAGSIKIVLKAILDIYIAKIRIKVSPEIIGIIQRDRYILCRKDSQLGPQFIGISIRCKTNGIK